MIANLVKTVLYASAVSANPSLRNASIADPSGPDPTPAPPMSCEQAMSSGECEAATTTCSSNNGGCEWEQTSSIVAQGECKCPPPTTPPPTEPTQLRKLPRFFGDCDDYDSGRGAYRKCIAEPQCVYLGKNEGICETQDAAVVNMNEWIATFLNPMNEWVREDRLADYNEFVEWAQSVDCDNDDMSQRFRWRKNIFCQMSADHQQEFLRSNPTQHGKTNCEHDRWNGCDEDDQCTWHGGTCYTHVDYLKTLMSTNIWFGPWAQRQVANQQGGGECEPRIRGGRPLRFHVLFCDQSLEDQIEIVNAAA